MWRRVAIVREKLHLLRRQFRSASSAAVRAEDDAEDTRVLEIWAWGKGEAGQLGLGDEEYQPSPRIVTALPETRVSGLALPMPGVLSRNRSDDAAARPASAGITCGLFHSGYWANGQLWMWGKGDGGRLGFGSEQSLYVPRLNPYLEHVQTASLGGLHSMALTQDGAVYTWGFGGFGALGHGVYTKELYPRQVKGEWADEPVALACGGSHSAVITSAGDLYTWGRDEGEGRLGHGFDLGEGCVPTPTKVEHLPVAVNAVSCGGFFTMALTTDGQLWGWGGNSNYELGTGDRRSHWKARPVAQLENIGISQVACGAYHTLALTEDGQVLTWGHGGHGQLGHGLLELGKIPTPVAALQGKRVVHVSAGGQWSLVVVESGEIYAWGKNRDWQVGVPGLPDVQPQPVQFSLQSDRSEQGQLCHSAVAVAAGASHGLCLGHGPVVGSA